MRFDSRTLTEFAKSLVEMTSILLDTPWKFDYLEAIQWIMRRKTSSILISWGQRKNQMMSHRSLSKLCLASGNDKEKTCWASIDEQAFRSLLGAMLFKDSPWFSEFQQHLIEQRCTQSISSYLHLGLSSPTWLWLLNDVIAQLYLNEC